MKQRYNYLVIICLGIVFGGNTLELRSGKDDPKKNRRRTQSVPAQPRGSRLSVTPGSGTRTLGSDSTRSGRPGISISPSRRRGRPSRIQVERHGSRAQSVSPLRRGMVTSGSGTRASSKSPSRRRRRSHQITGAKKPERRAQSVPPQPSELGQGGTRGSSISPGRRPRRPGKEVTDEKKRRPRAQSYGSVDPLLLAGSQSGEGEYAPISSRLMDRRGTKEVREGFDEPRTKDIFEKIEKESAKDFTHQFVSWASNIDFTYADANGWTMLHHAVRHGECSLIISLIEWSDPNDYASNIKNDHGQTPLHFAVETGNPTIVKLLLKGGLGGNKADANIQDDQGLTPLHYAARGGNENIVELLLDNGADANAIDNAKRSPRDYAIRNKKTEIDRLLMQRGGLTKYKNMRR